MKQTAWRPIQVSNACRNTQVYSQIKETGAAYSIMSDSRLKLKHMLLHVDISHKSAKLSQTRHDHKKVKKRKLSPTCS